MSCKPSKHRANSNQQPERHRVTLDFSNETVLTQQNFKDESDVNTILKRFADTGILDHVSNEAAKTGYASSQSFTEAMFIVMDSERHFMSLPSEIRKAFDNDPATFLDAYGDPSKDALMVELGLTPKSAIADEEKAPTGATTPSGSSGQSEGDT